MPSFDIVSEVDMPSLKNALDVAGRKIGARHDFKDTAAAAELSDKTIWVHGDSDFQIDQVERLVLPELTAKKNDIKCLEKGSVQKVSGNKVKVDFKVKVGIEQELAKKIVKLIKERR